MTRQLLAIGALLSLSATAALGQAYGTYDFTAAGLPRYAKEYAESTERLHQAHDGRDAAVRNYYDTRARTERNLSASLGLDAAKERLTTAADRFDKARADALAQLRDDRDYANLQAQAEMFALQLQSMRKLPVVPQSQIERLAVDKLETTRQVTAMEAAVLERDAAVQQARADMIAARKEIDRLDGEVRRRVDADANVIAARDRIDQIDATIAKTRVEYAGARAAYATAVDELDRQDWFRYHRGYYDYGYGYHRPHYHRYNSFIGLTLPYYRGYYR